MTGMKDVVQTLKESDLKGKGKVMIGGVPVTQSYADEIEADGYSPNAASAADKAKELLGIYQDEGVNPRRDSSKKMETYSALLKHLKEESSLNRELFKVLTMER